MDEYYDTSPGFGADEMYSGASSGTDWGAVLANGLSRAFDVAGQVYIARNLPYYQTQTAANQVQNEGYQKMLMIGLVGAAILIVLARK